MRKLAITISGAVSLGSYEAGVLYEVFAALKSHNTECEIANASADKILIDVITGASAGGMSAAIAVQKLLYAASELDGAASNSLYQPWVKDISLQKLLVDNAPPNTGRSILCSDVIEQIATKHLLARYDPPGPVAEKPHPAAGDSIRLGLAMSNMNGVDYGIKLQVGGDFIYTRFADEVKRNISGGSCNTLNFWQPVQQMILACGAFPFAFLPREVPRTRSDYTRPNVRFPASMPDPMKFAYVDGGLFQNEPLGLAKNLVEDIELADASAAAVDDRTYLYIAPSIRQSEACYNFSAGSLNYFQLAARLVTSIFNQARFQDWIDTEAINDKIRMAHARTGQRFEDALKSGRMTVDQLHAVSQSLAPAAHHAFVAGTGPSGLVQARRRGLEHDYNRLHADPSVRPAGADAWINAVTATHDAAGAYDLMRVDTIVAKPDELSSGSLEAFAGFFDESYRQHDYDIGRLKAQQVLGSGSSYLGQLRGYTPVPPTPAPSATPGIDPTKLDRNLRIQLRNRLRVGIKAMLAQTKKINWFECLLADWFVIRGLLNKWLEL